MNRRASLGLLIAGLAAGHAVGLAAQCRPLETPAPPTPTAPNTPRTGTAAPPASASAAPMTVQAGQLQVSGVSRDRLQLSVPLTFTAQRNGALRQVVVESLAIDGLPLYAAPLAARIEMKAGVPQPLPTPLVVSVYYRDIDSLGPLAQLLRNGHAHVTGALVATAQLGLGARLLLATATVPVPIEFEADVPVEVPGPPGARAAAAAVVGAADLALNRAANGAQSALALASARRRDLLAQYGPALAAVTTQFTLRAHNGAEAFTCNGLGLRIAPDRLLLLKSALQPWKFDPDFAAAIQAQHLALDPAGYEVTAEFAAGAPLRLSRGELRLGPAPPDAAQQAFVPQTGGKVARIQLDRQESPSNLATLLLTAPPPPGPTLRFDHGAPPAAGESLAVFRVGRAGPAHPNLLFLDAAPAADGFELASPLDPSAWGTPVVGPGGVTGIVQSQTAVLPVARFPALLQLP